MGAQPERLRHRELPQVRCGDLSELAEAPAYFKKEIKQSSEMSYEELRRYIHDLEQSGFDVVRLRVQLQKKIAYPLITLVMAVLAIPFALSAGKRSAVAGSRDRHRHRRCLLDDLWPVRGDGQFEPASACGRGLVSRPGLRLHRRVSYSPDAHLRVRSDLTHRVISDRKPSSFEFQWLDDPIDPMTRVAYCTAIPLGAAVRLR